MHENNLYFDTLFSALADSTRRDILRRVMDHPRSVGELAEKYKMSFAAVSLHLKVLEKAKLIMKTRQGKQQIVSLSPAAFKDVSQYLQQYDALWKDRFDTLRTLIEEDGHDDS